MLPSQDDRVHTISSDTLEQQNQLLKLDDKGNTWLHRAEESLNHAHLAGEMITNLGGHPSLKIGTLLETHKHDIGNILHESLAHEQQAAHLYHQLLDEVTGHSVMLEEYARQLAREEEEHIGEVDKMLRKPGDIRPAAENNGVS